MHGMGVTDIFSKRTHQLAYPSVFLFASHPLPCNGTNAFFCHKCLSFFKCTTQSNWFPFQGKQILSSFSTNIPPSTQFFSYQNSRRRRFRKKRGGTDHLFQTTRVAKIACCLGNLFQRRKAMMGIQDKSEGNRRAPLQPLPPLHADFLKLLARVSNVCL